MFTIAVMPSKRPAFLVRLDPDVKDAVAAAAARDGRSASNFLERLIIDWLRPNGKSSRRRGSRASRGAPDTFT